MELGEKALDFLGNDVPQFELSQAGRIDDPAAEIQLQQLRRGRGMPAFLIGVAHVAHPQSQARLQRVEQRRLAHAALAGEDRLPVLQEPAKRAMPSPFVALVKNVGMPSWLYNPTIG